MKAPAAITAAAATLTASTETLPPRDERDAAVKSLEAKCREICNLANDVRTAESAMFAAEQGDDKTALMKAAATFGGLRERLYNLKDEIERDLKHANLDLGFDISVSHTAEGLPIRVNHTRRVPLWG